MKNKMAKSLRPFVTFGIALAILGGWIFLMSRFDWAFLMQIEIFVFYLFFWLMIEAASQANPDQVASPLNTFLIKYASRRDRIVALIASIAALIFLSLNSLLQGNRFLILVLLMLGAIVVYYGTCLLFGTQELKDRVIPRQIKRMLRQGNSEKE